jgi:hypothetical protein
MIAVHIILAARVLVKLLARFSQYPGSGVGERLGVKLRVLDQRFDTKVIVVRSCPTFDNM